MVAGTLALLGSGETGPGMTKVHRGLFARLDEVRGANLNTPYGFQENVPQMTEKLLGYFSTSLHVDLAALDLRRYDAADGAVYVVRKTGPLKRPRNFTAEFVYRDGARYLPADEAARPRE